MCAGEASRAGRARQDPAVPAVTTCVYDDCGAQLSERLPLLQDLLPVEPRAPADHIMDGHCRWKQEDHMRDVYSRAPLADKLKASFFMADAERIVQRRNSPASRPVRRVLVSDSSGSGSD